MIVPGIGQTLALPGKLSYSFWKTGNLWKTIFWLQNAWKYKLIVLISFLFKWPWCKWDNAWRGVHNQELMDSMSFNIRRFLLKKGCNLRASADLDYSGRAVWSILMFIFWGVFFFSVFNYFQHYNAVLLWSSRNVLRTTKLYLTFYQHEGKRWWLDF